MKKVRLCVFLSNQRDTVDFLISEIEETRVKQNLVFLHAALSEQGQYWLFDATTASLSCIIVGVVVIGVISVVGVIVTYVVVIVVVVCNPGVSTGYFQCNLCSV